MKITSEIKIVKAFIEAINKQDIAGLSHLMTTDHTFIDSGGKRETGRDVMITGWSEYFRMFPDYKIHIGKIMGDEDLVAVFGTASGTYNGKRGLIPENRIEMPAAWKAVVTGGKIELWQVYADWTEGYKIIEKDNLALA